MSLKELKQDGNVKISDENFFEEKDEKNVLMDVKQKEEETTKRRGRFSRIEKSTRRITIGFTDREMYQIEEKTRGLALSQYFKSIILKELGLMQ